VTAYTLARHNTLDLTANDASQLSLPAAWTGTHVAHIVNFGPGSVWIRTDSSASIAVGDVAAEYLPPNAYDNDLKITNMMRIVADANTRIVVRVTDA
jgi:hypothetical protein